MKNRRIRRNANIPTLVISRDGPISWRWYKAMAYVFSSTLSALIHTHTHTHTHSCDHRSCPMRGGEQAGPFLYFPGISSPHLFKSGCSRPEMHLMGSFRCGVQGLLHRGMQDLAPRPGTEPRPPALGPWSLTHWTTREAPLCIFI